MKGVLVVLGQWAGREAAARVIDGKLDDIIIAPPADLPAPEAIFRATVGRPVKGMGGVFADLPDGRSGFLRQVKGLRPGQSLLVQVAGVAEPGKAVPLTTRLLFKSRYAIVTPDAPGLNISRAIQDDAERSRLAAIAEGAMADAPLTLGLILRSACAEVEADAIAEDIAAMRDLALNLLDDAAGGPELLLDAPGAHQLAWRDWALPEPDEVADGDDSFAEHGIAEMLDALLAPDVPLANGAGMTVEPTRALVAVDVNTGNDTSPAAGFKASLAAARELPRQLRLRGLGGQVVVDFAPCPKKDRQVLEQTLRAAFRRDGSEVALAGWTPLGNFELQRKRDRMPLSEVLAR